VKGDPKVIALLNEALKSELTAINQYFLHGEMCSNWGYKKLYKKLRADAIDEMKHAEQLMERILYLDGTPSVGELFKVNIGRNVKEQIENDLALEVEAVARYNKGIKLCESVQDGGSRELLKSILVSEEEHVDHLETQLHSIKELGIQNYLAQQLHAD
jgi:bacterioferritin